MMLCCLSWFFGGPTCQTENFIIRLLTDNFLVLSFRNIIGRDLFLQVLRDPSASLPGREFSKLKFHHQKVLPLIDTEIVAEQQSKMFLFVYVKSLSIK